MGFHKIDKYKSLIKTRYHGQKQVTTANIIHNVCEEPVLLSCVREELKLCLLTALLKPAVFTHISFKDKIREMRKQNIKKR